MDDLLSEIQNLLGRDTIRPEDRVLLDLLAHGALPRICPAADCQTTYLDGLVMGRHLLRMHRWSLEQVRACIVKAEAVQS